MRLPGFDERSSRHRHSHPTPMIVTQVDKVQVLARLDFGIPSVGVDRPRSPLQVGQNAKFDVGLPSSSSCHEGNGKPACLHRDQGFARSVAWHCAKPRAGPRTHLQRAGLPRRNFRDTAPAAFPRWSRLIKSVIRWRILFYRKPMLERKRPLFNG